MTIIVLYLILLTRTHPGSLLPFKRLRHAICKTSHSYSLTISDPSRDRFQVTAHLLEFD